MSDAYVSDSFSMAYESGSIDDDQNPNTSFSTLDRSLNELSVKILDRHIKRNNEINNSTDSPSPLKEIEEEPDTLIELTELDINESDYPDVCTHCEKCMVQVRDSVQMAVYN
jgi:hypothetical protein